MVKMAIINKFTVTSIWLYIAVSVLICDKVNGADKLSNSKQILTSSINIPNGTFPQMSHPVDSDMIIRLPSYAQLHFAVPEHFKKRSAKIMLWTPLFGTMENWSWWFRREKLQNVCPDVDCEFTTDRSQLDSSDAVIFQVYSGNFLTDTANDTEYRSQLPERRLPNQRYIYYGQEPPEYGRNMSRLNGFFNWTVTHRRDSDVVAHYGRTILTRMPKYAFDQDHTRDYSKGKKKLVAWFVSHCVTRGAREEFVAELRKYVDVDIYGSCGNLSCNPPRSKECYTTLAKKYKFYLSFENSLCRDYVTEKFSYVLPQSVVPVVFGGGDYSLLAPPGSYIDALAFEGGPRHLAEYLLKLDADDQEYNRFFDWKRGYELVTIHHPMYICDLCIKLMDTDEPVKVYDDFVGWWNRDAVCRRWHPYPALSDTTTIASL